MSYSDRVLENKATLKVEFFKIIDNKTLKTTYSIFTNLHVDLGIVDTMLKHLHTEKKSEYNKRMRFFKTRIGGSLKLTRIENDANYTRLIYTITPKGAQ